MEHLNEGKYDIVLSSVVADEINKCTQQKQDILYNLLEEIEHTNIETNETIEAIANEIIKLDILKQKHRDDCLHIGSAIYGDSDCIISWNFRHLVNFKTIKGV